MTEANKKFIVAVSNLPTDGKRTTQGKLSALCVRESAGE